MSKEQNVSNVLTVTKSICGSLDVSKETVCLLLKELANEYDIHPAEFLGVTTETLNDFQQTLTGFRCYAEKIQEQAGSVFNLLQNGVSVSVTAPPVPSKPKKAVGRPKRTTEQTSDAQPPKKRGRKPKKQPQDSDAVSETPISSVQTLPEVSEQPLDEAEAFARKVEKLKFGKEYQLDILYRLDGRFVLSKQVMSDAEAIGVIIPRQDKNRSLFPKFVLHKDAAPRNFSYKMAEDAAKSLPEYLGHAFQVLSPAYNSSCKPFQIEIDMIMKKIGGDKLNLSNAAIARYVCDVE